MIIEIIEIMFTKKFNYVLLISRIRGFLGIMGPLIVAVGILMAYICGAFMEFRSVPYFIIGFPVLFLVVMHFTPETPHTLLRRNNLQESVLSPLPRIFLLFICICTLETLV